MKKQYLARFEKLYPTYLYQIDFFKGTDGKIHREDTASNGLSRNTIVKKVPGYIKGFREVSLK